MASPRFLQREWRLKVTEAQRQHAIKLCLQSDEAAAIGCMQAFATRISAKT